MPRSAVLATWTTAWLAGRASSDDVVDAVTGGDGPHVVLDLPAEPAAVQARHDRSQLILAVEPLHRADTSPPTRLGAALIAWRSAGAEVRLALPAPGDVRGLPGPAEFVAAAIEAGEAVHGGGLGLIPTRAETPSSAPAGVIWKAYVLGPAPVDPMQLSEAEHELAVAIRETATLFRAADLGGGGGAVGPELSRARRAGEHLALPPGFSPRAIALVAQAERLSIVMEIAARDARGGAVDRVGMGTRADALRALASTVRRARLIAYNCGFQA